MINRKRPTEEWYEKTGIEWLSKDEEKYLVEKLKNVQERFNSHPSLQGVLKEMFVILSEKNKEKDLSKSLLERQTYMEGVIYLGEDWTWKIQDLLQKAAIETSFVTADAMRSMTFNSVCYWNLLAKIENKK